MYSEWQVNKQQLNTNKNEWHPKWLTFGTELLLVGDYTAKTEQLHYKYRVTA